MHKAKDNYFNYIILSFLVFVSPAHFCSLPEWLLTFSVCRTSTEWLSAAELSCCARGYRFAVELVKFYRKADCRAVLSSL